MESASSSHLWGGRGASHSGLPCGVGVGNALSSGHCPHFLKTGWIDSSPPPKTDHCQSQSLHLRVRRKVKWQGLEDEERSGVKGLDVGGQDSRGLRWGLEGA